MRFTSFGLLFLSLLGCQYDPHAHLLSEEEPAKEDLVGVYVKDKCFIPQGCGAEPDEITVELRGDGSFIATNVPPWQLGQPLADFYQSFVSDTGHWTIDRMGTRDPGGQPIWGVYLRDPGDDILPADVTGGNGNYGLIFGIGDPDQGNAITLKRK